MSYAIKQCSGRPRCQRTGSRSNAGFTLVELVIAIVVLAAASAGVLLIFANATAASADPQIRAQARAVAAAYMDEILLQPYVDPDGDDSGEDRVTFDDVDDYDGLNEPPTDMFGDEIGGLGDYTVQVTVSSGDPAEIDVRVRHDSGRIDYALHGKRHDY
ncbi:MAG: prepilin-type N-terminal cleavage/methylation domain-containing protein [Halofilum sp. (in: g-proteobacteria)]